MRALACFGMTMFSSPLYSILMPRRFKQLMMMKEAEIELMISWSRLGNKSGSKWTATGSSSIDTYLLKRKSKNWLLSKSKTSIKHSRSLTISQVLWLRCKEELLKVEIYPIFQYRFLKMGHNHKCLILKWGLDKHQHQ